MYTATAQHNANHRRPQEQRPNLAAPTRRRHRGFTLIEMIMGIVVGGILVAVSVPMLSNGFRAYEASRTSLVTLDKMRYATERMAREVREVRRNPVTPANFDITTMNATTLNLIKQDGVRVILTTAGTSATLAYDVPNVTAVLTDQLGSLQFTYFQADGSTAATNNSNVAFVQIVLNLTQGTSTYSQRVRVNLRNKT